MKIALLGTGTMGTGMAHAMLRAGLDVRVWNRNPDRAAPLAADGATVAATAAEAVASVDVVITMLFDADAVIEVMTPILDDLGPDTVWVQASTVGVEGTARIAALAEAHSVRVLDLPVAGTKKPAEDGTLVLLLSGDQAASERVQPVLDAIGSRVVPAGDAPGAATALKLAVNSWVASINAATGQALAMARGLGVDPQLFLDTIAGGPTDTPYAQLKGAQMLAGDYPVAFALDGALKDVELMIAAAGPAAVDTTVLQALREVYRRASDSGHGGQDMAAVYTTF
jgi:3-hydroxyisobutyrate dehydrogenase